MTGNKCCKYFLLFTCSWDWTCNFLVISCRSTSSTKRLIHRAMCPTRERIKYGLNFQASLLHSNYKPHSKQSQIMQFTFMPNIVEKKGCFFYQIYPPYWLNDYCIYIYIYNFEWRNWYCVSITITGKSDKHPHATYGALNSCFDLIRSHRQCTPWSPALKIEPTITVCRSRNSTTGPPVHATYKQCRINKSWWIVRPLDLYIYIYIYI